MAAASSTAAVLDPRLLGLLVCPEDKEPLWFFADRGLLFNERLNRTYEVRNNIPVLLVDDATTVTGDVAKELVAAAKRGEATLTGPKSPEA